ncbi:MAG: hypothetical protein WCJ93_10750 [Methanomicrobiales archaeon]
MTAKARELANIICGDCGYEIAGKNRAERDPENQTGTPQCTCTPLKRGTGGCGHD